MSYLSKKSEDTLSKILEWSKQKEVNELICSDDDTVNLFVAFETDLINLRRAREKQNQKTWMAIKERRKTDKNYCRPHKER